MTEFSTQSVPLFAAGIFELIFFIVFVVISILGQIFNKEKQQPRPRPRQPNQPPGQDPADPLEAEIADFVRRAQGGGEIIEAEPVRERPNKQREPRRRLIEGGGLTESSLEEHVERHLGSELSSPRPQLASNIENRDEAMEAHLQEVFDHSLGQLKPDSRMEQPDEDDTSTMLSPSEIRAMFASREDVRKAIIMNEILSPPTTKWD